MELGIHSRSCLGSSEVCAPVTAAQVSRDDSRAIGSLLLGSAMSLCKASQSDVQAPAEPPVEPTRLGSTFHSLALERMVWSARAASCRQALTGGSTPCSMACAMKR